MAGVIYHDGARLAFHVFDLDDPDLRVDRAEGDPFGILGRVMVIPEPGFAGMPVLARDQAVEPELESFCARRRSCLGHALSAREDTK